MSIVKAYNRERDVTYVYESESYWDKDKKQPRARRRLIGKIDPETGEIVPTGRRGRPRKDADASQDANATQDQGAVQAATGPLAATDGDDLRSRLEDAEREVCRLRARLEESESERRRLERVLARVHELTETE